MRTVQFLEWLHEWPDGGVGWQDQPADLVDDVIRYMNYRDWLKEQNPDIKDKVMPARPSQSIEDFEARVSASIEAAGMKVEEFG